MVKRLMATFWNAMERRTRLAAVLIAAALVLAAHVSLTRLSSDLPGDAPATASVAVQPTTRSKSNRPAAWCERARLADRDGAISTFAGADGAGDDEAPRLGQKVRWPSWAA